jgi:PAS domain S-box-containing protein
MAIEATPGAGTARPSTLTPLVPGAVRAPAASAVVLGVALAYALVGALALFLAGPPGYASPLFPSAGIALAAVLAYGRIALPGVALGSLAINLGVGLVKGPDAEVALVLPVLICLGATVQAAVGAALLQRFLPQPLLLQSLPEILRAGALGALLACGVSATVATTAMTVQGTLDPAQAASNWLTSWLGDTLGVLIGTPAVLAFIGRPRRDWAPRRRTVALPLLLALALLGTCITLLERAETQRATALFERDSAQLTSGIAARLATETNAFQAMLGAVRALPEPTRETLQQAAQWWWSQPLGIQAFGWATPTEPAQGMQPALASSVLLKHRIPHVVDDPSVGVDLGVDAYVAEALQQARRSAQVVALVKAVPGMGAHEPGHIVLAQALYQGDAVSEAARQVLVNGYLLMQTDLRQALEGVERGAAANLRWCLYDQTSGAPAGQNPGSLLAGMPGCEALLADVDARASPMRWDSHLALADRKLVAVVDAPTHAMLGKDETMRKLWSLSGLLGAALLSALLLAVTGHSRRTELAVEASTAKLRLEVHERTEAEIALSASEARLRNILNHVPLGVWFLDPDGYILDSNPRIRDMTGRSADDMLGLSVTQCFGAEEHARLLQMRRGLVKGSSAVNGSEALKLLNSDGSTLSVRVVASALRDDNGRVLRMVAVVEDITESLRLLDSERALQSAEAASRAKTEFVSRMSHELRTPLNAMIGFAQLLELDKKTPLSEAHRRWTQQIQRAGWHLLALINDTLDLARIESGTVDLKPESVPLQPLLAACLEMVESSAAECQVALTPPQAVDPEDGALAVTADATRLKQVLTNLLSNAVKYNRKGGTVSVHAQLVPARAGGPGEVQVTVSDTGLGMSAEQLANLFQPFNRLGREASDVQGTGIGLVISRRLAEMMGGTLEVQSQPERGTTFVLSLPSANTLMTHPAPIGDSALLHYHQRVVHYVEDNLTNIEVMRGVLLQRSQVVLETSTLGLDGLGAIRRRRPDLVLLDMQLPDISGLELLRHLKRDPDLADIPVIVVSADAIPQHAEKALASGALHYVTKPVDVPQFLALVDEALQGMETCL